MELLARLTERCRLGALEPLEVHFARLMERLDGRGDPALVLGAVLTSHLTASGHVCADLRELAGRLVLEAEGAEPLLAPDLPHWIARLRDSPVVGAAGEFKPLVLDPVGRLYLHRYWDYERQLAQGLRARARERDGVDEARLKADLTTLFAQPAFDWQRVAAATAVLQRLVVISGGPGTGKTTTVTRILALLLSQDPQLRIQLAAPTGKAAGRMQEAIRQAKDRLPLAPGLRTAIPEQAATLHRLLGWRPGAAGLRHGPDNPLALDVLVVDEASMVDLALMTRLLGALPPGARLILLGDKDQLASVEAGAVLADICG
ncbi:MAG: AAA family ATPase, partial [Candidatus Competibacteraceae bacterium]|nr:AAA family ATPase [Candidatus Competibacteraceae bacterium]